MRNVGKLPHIDDTGCLKINSASLQMSQKWPKIHFLAYFGKLDEK
jgi:hypothetical protein